MPLKACFGKHEHLRFNWYVERCEQIRQEPSLVVVRQPQVAAIEARLQFGHAVVGCTATVFDGRLLYFVGAPRRGRQNPERCRRSVSK